MQIKSVFIFCLALLWLQSCKTVQSTASNDGKNKKNELSEKERLGFSYVFHNAGKEKIIGNYEVAANLYAQCIKIDNTIGAPYYELAGIYNFLGNYKEALGFAQKAAKIDPSNSWYLLQYADLLQANNQPEKAFPIYEQLAKENPERIDYYYEWGEALLRANKLQDALKVYNKIQELISISEEVSVQKQRIYMNLGNTDKAIVEMEQLIAAFPLEARYYGMLAEMYQSKGDDDKALATFNKALEVDPDNPYIYLSLADFYNRAGETEKAFAQLKKAFANESLDIDTKVKILLSYYALTERKNDLKEEAFSLVEILVKTHPAEAKSYAIYGDFLYRDNRLKEAREQFRMAIKHDNNKFVIWNQLLIIESELSDFPSMEKESAEAMELFPTQPSFYLFNGVAQIQQRKFEEAIGILKMGAILVVDNDPLVAQFYSNLGEAYFKNKQHSLSDGAYDKCLKYEPDNILVLNNYSYYLSLRKEQLEKAEAMSKKCNSLSPNNSSFQDTYAWILYELGKYDEAIIWIEKAIVNGGSSSAVILEHKGDILFKLGEKEKALEYWKKAKDAGKGSEFLEKKIVEINLFE